MSGRFKHVIFLSIYVISILNCSCLFLPRQYRVRTRKIVPKSAVICVNYKGVTVISGDQGSLEFYLWLSERMITDKDIVVRMLQLLQSAEPASESELGLGGINGELIYYDELCNPVCYVVMYATSRVIAVYSPVFTRKGEYYVDAEKYALVRSSDYDKLVLPIVQEHYKHAMREIIETGWGGYIIERRTNVVKRTARRNGA
ncbi:MAG: hypothetical protein U1E27_11380 [Kiritimatiellia bacterium]|nr:hypothetical protein [Kiritimatiellia bacterium]